MQAALAAGTLHCVKGAGEALGASILDSKGWHRIGAIPGLQMS